MSSSGHNLQSMLDLLIPTIFLLQGYWELPNTLGYQCSFLFFNFPQGRGLFLQLLLQVYIIWTTLTPISSYSPPTFRVVNNECLVNRWRLIIGKGNESTPSGIAFSSSTFCASASVLRIEARLLEAVVI